MMIWPKIRNNCGLMVFVVLAGLTIFFAAKAVGLSANVSASPVQATGRGDLGKVAPEVSSVSWAHDKSDLLPDPRAVFGRLANGFRYVLVPNAKPQDRTSMHLIVNVGSLHETDEELGIAHFLEHMLFNGTTHFPPGELVKYFQKIGMQFGPDVNARVGFFKSVYDINLPTSDSQSLGEALQVMQDYAEGALLLPAEVERERGVILAEKRARDSADYRAYVASLQFELDGTLFPERLPIGTEDVIRSATSSVFKGFYDRWYRPDNMVLVMVGDFDPDMARELVTKQFASMAARAAGGTPPDMGKIHHEGLKAFYHHEREIGSTTVTLQVLEHTAPPQDNAAYQQEQIEAFLANQIIRNRLKRIISESAAPITDASAGSGVFLRQVRYGYISADCQPHEWQAALATIEQTLRQALQYGFDEGEIERVKKDYRAALDLNVAQAETRESSRLARALIHAVSNHRVFRSPAQEKAFADPIIDAITADGLKKRLHEVWAADHRLILVSGNAAIDVQNGMPEDYILSVFNQSQTESVARPQRARQEVFPYLEPPTIPGRIADRKEYTDLGISMIRFANDVRLNIKPTAFSANEVQFVLSFGSGRSGVPPDKPALGALAEDVVNESGLGRMDKEALAQSMAGRKTEIQFGVRDDRFVFEGRSVPEELDFMFQLIYAHMVDPAFREDAWQLSLKRYEQRYRTMRQSVDGAMGLFGWRFFSSGDRRFGLPVPDEFEGLSAADLQSWIGPALRRGPMELSVVGDVDRETVVRLATQYLGGLPAKPTRPMAETVWEGPVFPAGRMLDVPVMTQVDKALLVMAFPTDDVWDIKRTRRLNVLAEIVSERLRLRIREKLGAAYSPGAFSWPSRAYPDYGLFIIHIPLATEALASVQSEVQAIIRDLRQEGVSPAELQRALEPILTGIKDRFRENGYWLNTVLAGASRHPVQLEWSRTIDTDYAGIVREDIGQMIRRYLDPARLAIVQARAVEGAPLVAE